MSYSKLVAVILFLLINFALLYAGHYSSPRLRERYNLLSFAITIIGLAFIIVYFLDKYDFIRFHPGVFDWL